MSLSFASLQVQALLLVQAVSGCVTLGGLGGKGSSLFTSDAGYFKIHAVSSGSAEDTPVQESYTESLKSSCTSISIIVFMCCAQGTQFLHYK